MSERWGQDLLQFFTFVVIKVSTDQMRQTERGQWLASCVSTLIALLTMDRLLRLNNINKISDK